MKSFEKTYGKYKKYLVSFNNGNEYIECGPHDENPKFEGILIRELFSNKGVEFYGEEIPLFLRLLKFTEITYEKMKDYYRDFPLCTMIRDTINSKTNEFRSNFAIIISDYSGVKVKFFMRISHQGSRPYDTIRTKSPEFRLEEIIEILEDANKLLEKEK